MDTKYQEFFSGLLTPFQKMESRTSIRSQVMASTQQNITNQSTLSQKIQKYKPQNEQQEQINFEEELQDDEDDIKVLEQENTFERTIFTTNSFANLGLGKSLLKAIQEIGYKNPTKIQSQLIPIIKAGKDVYASSCTGSGKTAAYVLPLLERFNRTRREHYSKALVLLPTRELALQCYEQFEKLNQFSKCTAALVIGAVSVTQQEAELRKYPDIIFATPGRMLDILKNSYSIDLQNLEVLIFDEADRLMEMGFEQEIKEIIKETPIDRQTVLISATVSMQVKRLSMMALKNPVKITIDNEAGLAYGLKQYIVRIRSDDQVDREACLIHLLTERFNKKAIIFAKTRHQCHRLAMLFQFNNLQACELHGNLSQQQRLQAFSDFKEDKYNYLLATDLAARGLDIDNIGLVINFEIPYEVTRYIHRVGRTARKGQDGISITLCLESDILNFKRMIKSSKQALFKINVDMEKLQEFRRKIQKLEPKIKAIIKEEIVEKELRKAEMLTQKAQNMVDYHEDIMRKPRKQWIQKKKVKLQ
ncbi:hypothetical protein pb186bvf_010265 [Paramecium bursaria]